MATFAQIKTIRIAIGDPQGVIDIQQATTFSSLPADPAPQTAYQTIDTGRYYIHDGSSYQVAELLCSDTTISSFVTKYGYDIAICMLYGHLAGMLGQKMLLVRSTVGNESAQYETLKNLAEYYRQMRQDCIDRYREDNNLNTGRYINTTNPTIAGGNV